MEPREGASNPAVFTRIRVPDALSVLTAVSAGIGLGVLSEALTRISVPGVMVRTGRGPGKVAIPFSGHVGGARLKPGSYVASVTAIDGSGNRSRPSAVKFTVVPR